MTATAPSPGPAAAPSMQMMQLLWPGALAVQAVHAAAVLGVADLIAGGKKTIDELAASTTSDAASLARLLRALTSLGIFREAASGGGRYEHTPLSDVLRRDHPASMRPWALMLGAGFITRPTGALATAIRSGQPAFEHVFGTPFFSYLAEHPDDASLYDGAMSSLPSYTSALARAYDFSPFNTVVDVGGGHGALLTSILTAHPTARGVLYDLPAVVAGATRPSEPSVAERLEIVGGDFFESVPAGADAYLLSAVIHDWDDEQALRILRNCRRAINAGGRLLICDAVLTAASDAARAMMDLLMMLLTRGRERTEEEFRALVRDAGFELIGVRSTVGASILESRPV